MFPDLVLWPLAVIFGLILLLAVGLLVDALLGRRTGRPPSIQPRPRFVQTISRMILRRPPSKPPDETRNEER